MKTLNIIVKEIIGNCPVYKVGDRIVIDDGYKVNLSKTSAICMHSIASIMPYYVALSNGIKPKDLGLAGEENGEESAFVQCLDPCKYTGGGTVVFEIKIF
ncbi:hypothetical protein ES707_21545 [subsurface metagenome]